MRHQIEVALLEFEEGGNTLWVHGVDGTVLRIKTAGSINVGRGCTNNCPHCDLMIEEDIHFCVPSHFTEMESK